MFNLKKGTIVHTAIEKDEGMHRIRHRGQSEFYHDTNDFRNVRKTVHETKREIPQKKAGEVKLKET